MTEPTTETTEYEMGDDARAGEYVLRLMSPAETEAFQARLREEPALRRLVAEWEAHLVALTDDLPHVAPPPLIKREIQARLFGENAPVTAVAAGRGIWGWLVGGLAVAAVAGLLVFVGLPAMQGGDPLYQVDLRSEDGGLVIAAAYDEGAATLNVTRSAGDIAEGRDQELWLIVGEAAPLSLGVLPRAADGTLVLDVPLEAGLEGALFAITDEPLGGSPTGQATGAILATGVIRAL